MLAKKIDFMSSAPTDWKKKYKGVRRRKWGKWVSEIRVPGTQERLWLGTYATEEAAAVAHDVAFYCLRKPSSMDKLNFPEMLPKYCVHQQRDMSPRSVQKVASDVGMAVDAQRIDTVTAGSSTMATETETDHYEKKEETDDHLQQRSDRREGYWWEKADGCEGWQGSEDCNGGEALTISIEDYL